MAWNYHSINEHAHSHSSCRTGVAGQHRPVDRWQDVHGGFVLCVLLCGETSVAEIGEMTFDRFKPPCRSDDYVTCTGCERVFHYEQLDPETYRCEDCGGFELEEEDEVEH